MSITHQATHWCADWCVVIVVPTSVEHSKNGYFGATLRSATGGVGSAHGKNQHIMWRVCPDRVHGKNAIWGLSKIAEEKRSTVCTLPNRQLIQAPECLSRLQIANQDPRMLHQGPDFVSEKTSTSLIHTATCSKCICHRTRR